MPAWITTLIYLPVAIGTRTRFTLSTHMAAAALVQFNSSNDSLNTNLRFRWEYQPGSDLFIVYNEGRNTAMHGFPQLQNRTLVVKVTRLFRF